jgi:hypothetical protein
MRVRVWIRGAEGPVHDFELIDPPRCGERVSIALGGQTEEGIVSDVSWHLIGIERAVPELTLNGDPVGTVAMVHVVCRPQAPALVAALEEAALGATNPLPAAPQ